MTKQLKLSRAQFRVLLWLATFDQCTIDTCVWRIMPYWHDGDAFRQMNRAMGILTDGDERWQVAAPPTPVERGTPPCRKATAAKLYKLGLIWESYRPGGGAFVGYDISPRGRAYLNSLKND